MAGCGKDAARVRCTKKDLVMLIVEIIVAVIISLAMSLLTDEFMKLAPKREFFLDDNSIKYTYIENELVPEWLLGIFIIVMIVIAFVIELVTNSFMRALFLLIAYLFAVCPTVFLMEFLKVVVARLRPDFIDRCNPDELTHECLNPDELVVLHGRTSFPSGHCTMVFFGATILAVYFIMYFAPFKNIRHKEAKKGQELLSLRILLIIAPYIVAFYVAAERNTDHRHHPGDILFGALLGIAGGVLSLYFTIDLYAKFNLGIFGNYNTTKLIENPVLVDVENNIVDEDVDADISQDNSV